MTRTGRTSLLASWKALYHYRELLWMWTWREIRVRYKQSLLGTAWAILQPLSLMLIFTLVFSLLVRVPTNGIPYPIFSYTALLPWTLFTTAISFGVPSLVNNMQLVTKIYFPREILPLAAVGASLADFFVALSIFVGMMLFYGIPTSPWLALLPLILLLQIALILGVVFFASALNVPYRDIRFVVPLVTQLWMYATPIVYPASLVPERFRALYMLNPMAAIVESYRTIILHQQMPNWGYLGLAAMISLGMLFFGYAYFKHAEREFADII